MIPSQSDIKKREENLQKFLGQINPVTGKALEKDMVTVVRGAIRKSWMRAPQKLAFLYMNTVPDLDPNTRTKWKIQCNCCKEWFKINEVDVDHIVGNNTFTKVDDFESYFENILMVGFDGLQILCNDKGGKAKGKISCHSAKNLADRMGVSIDEAKLEKQIIEIVKSKKDKQFIIDAGIQPASNAKLRKEQIRQILKGGV